jgi:hypothetical protein
MHLSWIAIGFQIIEIWASHTSANIYSSNLGRFSAEITSSEIPRHFTRYETEKNVVSTIAKIEVTLLDAVGSWQIILPMSNLERAY